MNSFFLALIIVALLAVVASLALGLFVMVKGGEVNKKYGNKLMQARIILQAIAIGLFVIAFLGSR
ncbi:MAG: twin transmembrane helix small protein [Micavibrio aeruginosavorus]|nr:twin transmembrane helix small protein [Micavibrio aeruginosavorus]